MVEEDCAPVGDLCASYGRRADALDMQMSVLKAQVEGYLARLCRVEAQAITNIEFLAGGEIRLTRGNGAITTAESPYLVQLLNAFNSVLNDTTKITGGELASNGDLTLIRANGQIIELGNIIEVANPARAIEIRNDGRIEVTLFDAITKFNSSLTIQSQIPPPVSGGPAGVGLSLLTTPVEMAATSIIGASGSQDIAALVGVTVPVGTTHVLIRASVQHHALNTNADERQPNWTAAYVAGKLIAFAGRRSVNGTESIVGNYDIANANSSVQFIPLPGNNTLAWNVETIVAGVTNPAPNARRVCRAVFDVLGFVINGGSQ